MESTFKDQYTTEILRSNVQSNVEEAVMNYGT